MYRPITEIETIAKNANGMLASLPLSAGSATIRHSTAIASVALIGARFLLTRDHSWWPGTARSRLNANIIRAALVISELAQKNWPTVAMIITILKAAMPSDDAKMPTT